MPRIVGQFAKEPRCGEADIVDHHVEPPEAFDDGRNQRLYGIGLRYVANPGDRVRAESAGRGFGLCGIDVADEDGRAFGDEAAGDGLADPAFAASAGDDADLALESHVMYTPPLSETSWPVM